MEKPQYILKSYEGVLQPIVPEKKNRYRLKEMDRIANPFEMWFYADFFVLYREKYYYGPKDLRKEINKIFYEDIRECQNRLRTHRINIYAKLERTWYRYRPDGSLPEEPDYHGIKKSMCYIYIGFDSNTDIVSEIKEHSPIKIVDVNG